MLIAVSMDIQPICVLAKEDPINKETWPGDTTKETKVQVWATSNKEEISIKIILLSKNIYIFSI